MDRRRWVTSGLTAALLASTSWLAGAASAQVPSAVAAGSYWAISNPDGNAITILPVDGEIVAAYGLVGQSAPQYEISVEMQTSDGLDGSASIESRRPITAGAYRVGPNSPTTFEYGYNSVDYGRLTGILRITDMHLGLNKPTTAPGHSFAFTFVVRTETSSRPIYGAIGDDAPRLSGVPGQTSEENLGDFNGSGHTSLAVFRPSTGQWLIRGHRPVRFGRAGDVPVPGDYNGDGKSDIAVYRPSTGQWFVRGQHSVHYGRPGDIPVPGDYHSPQGDFGESDGRTDLAVFRPSTGQWFVKGGDSTKYGRPGDIPVPGFYNVDTNFKSAFAVFRPATGRWSLDTRFGPSGQIVISYGRRHDIPV